MPETIDLRLTGLPDGSKERYRRAATILGYPSIASLAAALLRGAAETLDHSGNKDADGKQIGSITLGADGSVYTEGWAP